MPIQSMKTRIRFGRVQVAVYWPVPKQRRRMICTCGAPVAVFYLKGKMLPLDLTASKKNQEDQLVAPAHVLYCPHADRRTEERCPNWE